MQYFRVMCTVKKRDTRPLLLFKGVFFIVFLFVCSLLANGQQFNFHNLSEASSSESYCVLQDKKGFIWFSSEKGLYCYDGHTFKCFNNDNGLPHNSVYQLTEDSKGRILFNNLQGKVGYVFHDSIFFPPLNKKLSTFLKHGSLIYDVYSDSNHILWIATYSGLFKTLKPDDYSDVEPVKPQGADSARVLINVIDGKKVIYSLYPGKFKKTKNGTQYRAVINNNGKCMSVPYFIDDRGQNPAQFCTALLSNGTVLWACLNTIYSISPEGKFHTKEFNERISYMYQDKTGGIWIGLYKQGLRYYTDISLKESHVNSLPGISPSFVFEDAEQGFWVSTLGRGIFHTNTKYVVDYSSYDGLNDKIAALGVVNNKIMVNDYNDFISVITDTGVRKIGSTDKIKIASVYNFHVSNDKVYIPCFPYFFCMDTLFNKWLLVSRKNEKRGSQMYDLAKSLSGKMYCVDYASLDVMNSDSLERVCMLPSRGICMCITKTGEILVGCENGLYRYNDGNFTEISLSKEVENVAVAAVKESNDGSVWELTLGNGIFIYKGDKIIKTISTQNGLASNYTRAIVFDSGGKAWVATDNGISKISAGNNYSVQNFGTRQGLISNEVLKLAIRGNYLWVGTVNGLCSMDITHLKKNTWPPPVYIGSISVNDKIVKDVEEFQHGFNNFKFHLQAPTFMDKESRFIYRLAGFDTAWNNSGSADILFTNLPPGTYKFEARAINADGVVSINPAGFSFTILNPFWKTWWFILFEIVSLGGLIYAFIQFRLKLIRRSEAEKTRINKMVTEYQMTALRAQMNPHFVFNAINSIQEYVLDNEPQKAYDYLTKFAQLVRMVLNNAKEKSISLEKELETLQAYIELEQLRFGNRFDFVLDVAKSADQYNIQLPAMIIQPYVENAIWHGLMPQDASKKGILRVSIEQNLNELKISIEDNGIGREKSALIKKTRTHKSVGMELTKQRLDMLNSLPEYSASSIEVFDLHDEAGRASGTRVEIKITTKPY